MANKEIKKETLKQSVGFSAVGSIGTQAVSLLSFIVLARLLSPHEFGLMAMVAIFTAFASIFIDMGMGAALIHNQKATKEHESTAFWFNVLLSIICLSLIIMSSNLIANFFQEEELKTILLVVPWLLLINALTIVPMSKIQKALAFKKVAMAELGGLVCGVLVAVVLALNNFGVWALVANLLVSALIKMILLFFLSGWFPSVIFKKDKLVELFSYSGYLMATGITNYFITNVDSALVGRLVGTAALGAYRYAYRLANMPAMIVNKVFVRVFFASYSTYKSDKERIRKLHFKAVRMIAFFTFPMLLTLAMVADFFVSVVLGDQWNIMAYILSFMCVIFLLDSIGGMNNPLFLSQGKTKTLFWLTLILRSNLIIAMFIGIQFGLNGLLWGLLIAKVINFLPVYHVVGKTVGFSVFSFVKNIMPPFACSLFVVCTLFLIQMILSESTPFINLSINIIVAIVCYLFVSLFFQRSTIYNLNKLLFKG